MIVCICDDNILIGSQIHDDNLILIISYALLGPLLVQTYFGVGANFVAE